MKTIGIICLNLPWSLFEKQFVVFADRMCLCNFKRTNERVRGLKQPTRCITLTSFVRWYCLFSFSKHRQIFWMLSIYDTWHASFGFVCSIVIVFACLNCDHRNENWAILRAFTSIALHCFDFGLLKWVFYMRIFDDIGSLVPNSIKDRLSPPYNDNFDHFYCLDEFKSELK